MIVGKRAFTALAVLMLCTGVAAPALKAQVPAAPGEFPWDVVILNKTASGFSFRGNGVLLNANTVLTTAGNVDGALASNLSVEAGTNNLGNGTIAPVSGYTMHSEFGVGPVTYANDIALIYLAVPLPMGEFIQPATLATDNSKSYTGATAVVAGWWKPDCIAGLSNSLLEGSIQVISTGEGQALVDSVPGTKVWDSQLCLYDSAMNFTPGGYAKGSGITVADGVTKVAGLCSWGVTSSSLAGGIYDYAGCMLPAWPHVGTRISAYTQWINDHMDGPGGGGQLLASPYTNLGNGTAGTGGETPMLGVSGYLTPGSNIHLDLSNVPAGSTTNLVVGLTPLNAPFKSGVLIPNPDLLLLGLPVGGDGTLSLVVPWPSSVPAGVNVYVQEWIVDAGGAKGFAASNGLQILTP